MAAVRPPANHLFHSRPPPDRPITRRRELTCRWRPPAGRVPTRNHYSAALAVLLGFHGALTWGANLTEAWYRMEALENYAKITLNVCYLMRSDAVLTREQLERCTGGLTPADRLNGRIG